MHEREEKIEEANRHLMACGPVTVRFWEYQVSHSYLHLVLTDGPFDWKANVVLSDCSYIAGPVEGGPWQLEVGADGDGVELATGGGELIVRAGRVRVEVGASSLPLPGWLRR